MRQSERISLDESTRLRPNDWSSLEVRIMDYSEAGFRADCEAKVAVGSHISVDVPGVGPVEAQVTWCRQGQFGARFKLPLDLEACSWTPVSDDSILARLLVQRAAARTSGLFAHEQQIRRQILAALPMHKGAKT